MAGGALELDRFPRALADACVERVARLASKLEAAGADALLLSDARDMQYLTGFGDEESTAVIFRDRAVIISDSRYDEVLQPWRARGTVDVVMGVRHRLLEAVHAECDARSATTLAVQAESITVAGRQQVAAALGDSRVVDTTDLVKDLRRIKDGYELELIENACRIHQEAMRATLPQLRLGMPELEAAGLLEFEMKKRGADRASFSPMVATGANSAVIHYATGATPIERGVLLMDWGAEALGYCSDMTRTFSLGAFTTQMAEIYRIVLDAQLAAIDAIEPGKTCASIDKVARDVITNAGYGEYFGHGLGHGLGLLVHEEPYFNNLSTDVLLEPGMVMTVEPGVYLPGTGGVRIEDDVVVTERGCRLLSAYPKGIEDAVIEPGA